MYNKYKYELKPLPYGYDDLQPYIDSKTIELHHNKHLQKYIDNLNIALEPHPALQRVTLEQLLSHKIRLHIADKTMILNNAGGVYNHNFYFDGLTPISSKEPTGALYNAIIKKFGTIENFKIKFKESALSVFGSGYTWLVLDWERKLNIIKTANQETPLEQKLYPILTIDVWEHAYYLKHYNKRDGYIDDWFDIIDWNRANEIYLAYEK